MQLRILNFGTCRVPQFLSAFIRTNRVFFEGTGTSDEPTSAQRYGHNNGSRRFHVFKGERVRVHLRF
jgi:hypothetical protein